MNKEPPSEANFDILLQEKKGSWRKEQEANRNPKSKRRSDRLLQEKKGSSRGEQKKPGMTL